jgi:heme-degrading monooxygenase HmoA
MIYELRHYVVVPGKGEAVLNRFKNHTFKIFERRGFKVHDFWLEANGSGHLWYVLEWQSAEQMESEWINSAPRSTRLRDAFASSRNRHGIAL